jgi:hypothetical protein
MDFGWPFVFLLLSHVWILILWCFSGVWVLVRIAYTLSVFGMGMERFSLDYYCIVYVVTNILILLIRFHSREYTAFICTSLVELINIMKPGCPSL